MNMCVYLLHVEDLFVFAVAEAGILLPPLLSIVSLFRVRAVKYPIMKTFGHQHNTCARYTFIAALSASHVCVKVVL